MIFVSELKLISSGKGYPFLPLIANTPRFCFTAPVTVICGDNGCGKTTFAKILSAASKCVNVAYQQKSEQVFENSAKHFSVIRKQYPKRSFYFSAEEFVRFVQDVEERRLDAIQAIEEINSDSHMSDYAKGLARMPHEDTLMSFESFYGKNLAEVSHGQGFLTFFDKRLKNDGFYIIDEPEAALTSENQFLLAAKINDAAKNRNCQFVICTHSPVISAIPNAAIFEISQNKFVQTEWESLENVSFLSMFFKNKDRLF